MECSKWGSAFNELQSRVQTEGLIVCFIAECFDFQGPEPGEQVAGWPGG